MLFEFITSDEFLFWTLIAVLSALIVWFTETGDATAAGVTLITLFVGAAFFPNQWMYFGISEADPAHAGEWLLQNSWRIVLGLVCYFLLGLLWATFRWWLHVHDAREAYDDEKRRWLAPGNLLACAGRLEVRSATAPNDTLRQQYHDWASACRLAADAGGHCLSDELKPVWKDFVENGYRT